MSFPWYTKKQKKKIADYQDFYASLFAIAHNYDLRIYLKTDAFFSNASIKKKTGKYLTKKIDFMASCFLSLFTSFSYIDGIIIRIGESDGVDIQDDFKSELCIKTSKQANEYLQRILPLFETYHKECIFRTWTVGAYPIGDIMWNEKTFQKVFMNIFSPNLIISLKYGESDFYRYLEPTKLIAKTVLPVIIELQTRREYEGFGSFPVFVGWEYYRYFCHFRSYPNLKGISVWCQTGGWSALSDRTYLERSSFWNELNTEVTLFIWHHQNSVFQAVQKALRLHAMADKTADMMKFLKLSDQAINIGWYIRDFAQSPIYFRRVRLPNLLWIFWDTIILNLFLSLLLNQRIRNKKQFILDGKQSLEALYKMKALADILHLPMEEIEYEMCIFSLLFEIRKYIIKPDVTLFDSIERQALMLAQTYPNGIHLAMKGYKSGRFHRFKSSFIHLVTRERKSYRLVDRLFFKPPLSVLIQTLPWMLKKHFPSFVNRRAMSIKTLLT